MRKENNRQKKQRDRQVSGVSSASSPAERTGSDLIGRLANHRRSQTGLDQSDLFGDRSQPAAAVLTVLSQQHGDRFFQELAELCEPLRADRTVHHPVVTAQRHRHHAGYVEPSEKKQQQQKNPSPKY